MKIMKQKEKGLFTITDSRMTRFSITLQEGVNFVLRCLKNMWGGELFVPKIPSYRILDIAKAIAPKAKYEFIGIRPGEKLHEEMITKTDSFNAVEFNDYYVVLPSIPLWDIEKFKKESDTSAGKDCENGFSYDSGTNNHFLSIDQLKKLIERDI